MTIIKKREWRYRRDLLLELVVRDFKLRYKRSFLGIAWSLLVPLAQFGVLYLVFHRILPLNVSNYTVFLFTGLLPWAWFQTAVMAASTAIVDNRDLIRQVGFPVAILPTVTVTSQLIHFLLALPILAGVLYFGTHHFTAALLALPVIIGIEFALILSLAYIVATFQVTFSDTQHLLGIILYLFFFLTPVFYDPASIPASFRTMYQLNPMVHLLAAYRSILIEGKLPASVPLLALSAISAAVFGFGYLIFARASDRFAEEL